MVFVKSGLVVSAYLSSMCIVAMEEPFYGAPIAISTGQEYYLYEKVAISARFSHEKQLILGPN